MKIWTEEQVMTIVYQYLHQALAHFKGMDGHTIKCYYNACICDETKERTKIGLKDPWCACFVSYILYCTMLIFQNFYYDITYKRIKPVIWKTLSISCQRLYNSLLEIGCTFSDKSKARVGDIVFYDWDANGWYDHVGLVYEIVDNDILVLEGNYEKTVGARKLSTIKNKYTILHIPYYEMIENMNLC